MMSNDKMNSYMKQRYYKRRLSAIKHLGGSCEICESTEDLHFHHKDPSTKLFTISKASSFSEERFWNEVNKCVLLCGVCHSNHHKPIYEHGNVHKYWQGCRCALCKSANSEYHKMYKSSRSA